MDKKKKFKWIVEIEIDQTRVADLYEPTADNVRDAILDQIGYTYDDEVKTKLISDPNKKDIARAQKCGTLAHRRNE